MTTAADAQHVFNNWMNSADHRANILQTSYTEIGVAQQQIGGSVCSVQVFGSRQSVMKRHLWSSAGVSVFPGNP